MILVTLGTQDKKFTRLLDSIQKQIDLGNINEEVIVQAGCSSDYKTKDMKIFDLIPINQFDNLMSKSDLLITHGGVGSIITGLKNNKKIIAVARLKKYGEHTNDHQLQIIDKFSKEKYILKLENFDELDKILKKAKNFKTRKYKSNNKNFVLILEKEIEKYINYK